MVVCSCRAVTDREVRAAIAEGADSVEALTERCHAATACGGCWPELERLIAESSGDRQLHAVGAA
jgi:bacterioferritin-associated ferredoxin